MRGKEGSNGAATPREKLGGERGGGRKRRGAGLGAPRCLPPPPPFRTGPGEGRGDGGGAALTSLRAVPAREGGAESGSEPETHPLTPHRQIYEK